MKLYFIAILILLGPVVAHPQSHRDSGIVFQKAHSWQQIKEMARRENKFIFVDCFATWCGPCKKMDLEVYPDKEVGMFANAHFISLKLQMDTGKSDDEATKSLYATAKEIRMKNHIDAYPTFLFYDSEGQLVHRGIGLQKPAEFIALLRESINPNSQYYNQLGRFQTGRMTLDDMPGLAKTARKLHDFKEDSLIGNEYINKKLYKLPAKELLNIENLKFVDLYFKSLTSGSRIFPFFLSSGAFLDSLMHDPGYSKRHINFVIKNELIDPVITTAARNHSAPDWTKISANIDAKYGKEYLWLILNSKVAWYEKRKNYPLYTHYIVAMMDSTNWKKNNMGMMGAVNLNGLAWEIFVHSTRKVELVKACEWSSYAIESLPNIAAFLDTYANLLYKLGRRTEAIQIERKADSLGRDDPQFAQTLKKMINGKRTW